MKKFILIVFVAFVAQSEATYKCFKVIKDIPLYEFNQCYKELIGNNTLKNGLYKPILDNVEKNKTYLQTQGNRWCVKQYELMKLVVEPRSGTFALPTAATTVAPARRRRQVSTWQGCIDLFGPYTAAFLDENSDNNLVDLMAEVTGSAGTLQSIWDTEQTHTLSDPLSNIITDTVTAILAANQGTVAEYTRLICEWMNTESANAISNASCHWCIDYAIDHPTDLINALTPAP